MFKFKTINGNNLKNHEVVQPSVAPDEIGGKNNMPLKPTPKGLNHYYFSVLNIAQNCFKIIKTKLLSKSFYHFLIQLFPSIL